MSIWVNMSPPVVMAHRAVSTLYNVCIGHAMAGLIHQSISPRIDQIPNYGLTSRDKFAQVLVGSADLCFIHLPLHGNST